MELAIAMSLSEVRESYDTDELARAIEQSLGSSGARDAEEERLAQLALEMSLQDQQQESPEMSYEQLLELEDVSVGASDHQISALPQVRYSRGQPTLECPICLIEADLGDVITRLPCFHAFHSTCVHSWLQRSKCCPVCKVSIDD